MGKHAGVHVSKYCDGVMQSSAAPQHALQGLQVLTKYIAIFIQELISSLTGTQLWHKDRVSRVLSGPALVTANTLLAVFVQKSGKQQP